MKTETTNATPVKPKKNGAETPTIVLGTPTTPPTEITWIKLSDIDIPEEWNARSGDWKSDGADPTTDDGGYEGLRESMKVEGRNNTAVLLRPHPDAKSKKPYMLVDGFGRCLAAKELEWDSVRAIIETMNDFEARKRNIQAQTSHRRLKTPDLAWAIHDLKQRGGSKVTDETIAQIVGISTSYASVLRRIMGEVDAKVTAAWRAGSVKVNPQDLIALSVLPKEQHFTKWELLVLDQQTKPHGNSKSSAFQKLRDKCRAKGRELGVLEKVGACKVVTNADWTRVIVELYSVPAAVTADKLIKLASAMGDGYREGLDAKLKAEESEEE